MLMLCDKLFYDVHKSLIVFSITREGHLHGDVSTVCGLMILPQSCHHGTYGMCVNTVPSSVCKYCTQ